VPQTVADSHLRSLAKGLSWRCTATLTTIVIAGAVTGSAGVALTIGGIEALAKIGIYYCHERLWFRIPWGRTTVISTDPDKARSAPTPARLS